MPSTTTYDRGQVVVVSVPFSDQSGAKPRPALVVSADAFHRTLLDVILCPISSQPKLPSARTWRPSASRLEGRGTSPSEHRSYLQHRRSGKKDHPARPRNVDSGRPRARGKRPAAGPRPVGVTTSRRRRMACAGVRSSSPHRPISPSSTSGFPDVTATPWRRRYAAIPKVVRFTWWL